MVIKSNKNIKPFIQYVQNDPKLNKRLKVIIIFLIILILFSACTLSKAKANSNMVKVPENVNLTDNESSFDVILMKKLEEDEKVNVIVDKENYIDCGKEGKIKLNLTLSNYFLTNDQSQSTITIKHDDIPEGTWEGNIKLTFVNGNKKTVKTVKVASNISHKEIRKVEEKVEEKTTKKVEEKVEEKKEDVIVREEKTMYSYKTVSSWDESNYLLEKPNDDHIEKTQYTKEFAQFSNSSFSTSMPSDGFYREVVQYGYNTRTKQEISTPVTTSHTEGYNNVGSCPGDCISGTINDYGTGCECMINKTTTTYTHSINYGNWEEKVDSWRFDTPYTASDVIEPKERKVYLIPTGWNQSNEWSYEEPTKNNETKVSSRTVYLLPASYSEESACQDAKPTGEHIQIIEHKFYRIIKNGVAGEWQEEKTDK